MFKQRNATFWEALSVVGSSKGRGSRSEFLWCILIIYAALFAIRFLLFEMFGHMDSMVGEMLDEWCMANRIGEPCKGTFFANAAYVVPMLLSWWFLVTTCARRLHDLGLTGWLAILVVIPSIGKVILLILAIIPTPMSMNHFGPPPYIERQ